MDKERGVRFLFESPEDKNFVYRPENINEPSAQKATLDVKFSNDIFLMESFLIQMKVDYDPEDLEDGPYGEVLRIKKDDEEK